MVIVRLERKAKFRKFFVFQKIQSRLGDDKGSPKSDFLTRSSALSFGMKVDRSQRKRTSKNTSEKELYSLSYLVRARYRRNILRLRVYKHRGGMFYRQFSSHASLVCVDLKKRRIKNQIKCSERHLTASFWCCSLSAVLPFAVRKIFEIFKCDIGEDAFMLSYALLR